MKDSITTKQCGIICFFSSQVFKIALLPSLLYKESGRDAWLTIIVIMLIDFFQLALVIAVDSMGGIERVKEKYGNAIYFVVSVPLIAVEVLQGSVLMADVANYIKSTMFYYVSDFQIIVAFMIVTVFLSVRGAKGFGRLVELFVWIAPLIVVVGILGGKIDLTPHMILPVFGEGAAPMFAGIDRYLFWVLDFGPLLFLSIDTSRSPKFGKKAILISSICSVIFMIGFFLFFIMDFGGGAAFISIALSAISSFNVFNSKMGNLDWVFAFQWICIAAVTIGLKLFAVGKVVEKVKGKRQAGVLAAGAIVTALNLCFFYNSERAVEFSVGAVKYVVFGVQLAAPLAIFILLLILKLKHKEKKRTACPKTEGRAAEELQ